MDSQIYLMLLRQSGTYKDWSKDLKSATAATIGIQLKQLLKDIVLGDSLDTPFLKFIRVKSVSHKIGFEDDKESKFESSGWAYKNATTSGPSQYSPNPFQRSASVKSTSFNNTAGLKASGAHQLRETFGGGNQFVQSRIPQHGELEFKKHIDSATAQLAYGCSAQEKFPLAIFFYRRKSGLGVGGIRFPYFVMGAFKCKIKGWELNDDEESVSLYYRSVAWCGYEQFADSNLSFPWSTRWFDQEKFTGGQGGAAMALQILTAGLVLVAGAVSAGLEGGGTESGAASDL